MSLSVARYTGMPSSRTIDARYGRNDDGNEDRVHIRLLVRQVRKSQRAFTVKPAIFGNDPELEVAFQTIHGTGLQPLIEVVGSEVKGLAEIEINRGLLVSRRILLPPISPARRRMLEMT